MRGAALGALLLAASGCSLPSLWHDKMLGPISPAGQVHAVSVGSDFTVTDEGVVATLGNEPILRPYPLDFIRRIAQPRNFYGVHQGLQAIIKAISFVVLGETSVGKPLPADAVRKLKEGAPAGEVLRLLGSPNLWIRRSGGSVMAHRAALGSHWSFYLGMPPLADRILPIPGLNNLTFRWNSHVTRVYKTVLLFDADDRLRAWFQNDPDAEPGEPDA